MPSIGSTTQHTPSSESARPPLLAEDRIAGPQAYQPIPDEALGFGIDDGHRSVRVLLAATAADPMGCGPPPDQLGAAPFDERGRVCRHPLGDLTKNFGSSVTHRVIAAQISGHQLVCASRRPPTSPGSSHDRDNHQPRTAYQHGDRCGWQRGQGGIVDLDTGQLVGERFKLLTPARDPGRCRTDGRRSGETFQLVRSAGVSPTQASS